MTWRTILLAGTVAAAALLSAARPVSRVLIWNATASVPTGLYHIRGTASLHVGERVAIEPPLHWRRFLAARRYLPTGLPMLKEIAALPGETVCRRDHNIIINGVRAGVARARDSHGRALPQWQGCYRIPANALFVMNRRAPDSFDGRYFGILPRAQLIGRASPVWTDETGNGANVWFARPTLSEPANRIKETDT